MLQLLDAVSALALQKWRQYLHNVLSADKSGIPFFLIISNNVTLRGSLKYQRLIKGFFFQVS